MFYFQFYDFLIKKKGHFLVKNIFNHIRFSLFKNII